MKKKISLFHKLILSNILYSIPVIALVALMISAKNVNIDFAKFEVLGNNYQRPLENLLQFLGQQKMTPSTLGDHKETIAKLFADLQKVQDEIGEDLQFTQEGLAKRNRASVLLSEFKKRWNEFSEKFSGLSPADRAQQLSAFIVDVRTMIAHAGDTSNLILDPDLDSYYLMDVTLLALPQSQDRIQEVVSYVNTIKQNNTWTEKEKRALGVYAALLKQSDVDRITADFQTVLNEDPNFYDESPTLKSELDPAIKKYADNMGTFINLVQSLSEADNLDSTENVIKQGHLAYEASFSTWNVAVNELDTLLQKRIHVLVKDKYTSLALALSALIFAFGILFGVARSFNLNMKNIIAQLQKAVENTKSAGSDLVSVSETLSTGTNSQASAIQQTAAAIDEINSMIQATLANSTNAEHTANDSFTSTKNGHTAVADLYHAINTMTEGNDHIIESVQKSDEKMKDITRIISEIESKTKIINDIVFQTKLLSFNASVEAARAGENGKGFAVVAEEVGNLAQMSGTASTEISNILHESIKFVNKLSTDMSAEIKNQVDSGRSIMSSGQNLAEKCKNSLDDILGKVDSLKAVVISIHGAAEEQARGIEEISKAVRELDRVTQQNSVMSNQTAAYSKSLSEQAETLEHIVTIVESEVLGKAS